MTVPYRSVGEDVAAVRRAQSRIESRLNDVQGRPQTNSELRACREIQVRFDDTFRDLEMSNAPPPLGGESPRSYRARLLSAIQPYSETHRGSDLYRVAAVDSTVMDILEREIFSE